MASQTDGCHGCPWLGQVRRRIRDIGQTFVDNIWRNNLWIHCDDVYIRSVYNILSETLLTRPSAIVYSSPSTSKHHISCALRAV